MLSARDVAVIGGGFSGTLLAVNLLRNGIGRVTLIERAPGRVGRGLAYGRAQPDHVLNVRASHMSALPDEPGHFAQWLEKQGLGSATSFATRQSYGAYLTDLLERERQGADGRLQVVTGQAVGLEISDSRACVTLDSGEQVKADVAVLAPGNLPPHDLPAVAGLTRPLYVNDPWAGDIADGLGDSDTVMLLGNGLTAIDCMLTLVSSGFGGQIVALSRRGLSPHSHETQQAFSPRQERPRGSGSALVRAVRRRADEVGWRNAVDELRPFTPSIWGAADPVARRRFLRILRPFWDIHRHRLAPTVAARVAELRMDGRLSVHAGKLLRATPEDDGVHVAWRPRGSAEEETRTVARIINCTGPLGDLTRTDDPLLSGLAGRGLLRPDALAIGIDVDRQGRAVSRDGSSQERLFVVGPMTRGAHWEIVAVPDIRRQVWDLARYLTHAHWVSAEGL